MASTWTCWRRWGGRWRRPGCRRSESTSGGASDHEWRLITREAPRERNVPVSRTFPVTGSSHARAGAMPAGEAHRPAQDAVRRAVGDEPDLEARVETAAALAQRAPARLDGPQAQHVRPAIEGPGHAGEHDPAAAEPGCQAHVRRRRCVERQGDRQAAAQEAPQPPPLGDVEPDRGAGRGGRRARRPERAGDLVDDAEAEAALRADVEPRAARVEAQADGLGLGLVRAGGAPARSA